MPVEMILLVCPPSTTLFIKLTYVGKEFCGQLFGQPSATQTKKKPCINCPGNCMDINNLLSPANPNEGFVVDVQPPTPPMSAEDHETMRCDEAWKKLKVGSLL
jgi:hypothetical protein